MTNLPQAVTDVLNDIDDENIATPVVVPNEDNPFGDRYLVVQDPEMDKFVIQWIMQDEYHIIPNGNSYMILDSNMLAIITEWSEETDIEHSAWNATSEGQAYYENL